jgi:hypothetical protein
MLKVEEEGRKAWLQSRDSATTTTTTITSPTAGVGGGKDGGGVAMGNDGRNFGVRVGRSGGGV